MSDQNGPTDVGLLSRRLQNEGRWPAAYAFKEVTRRRFRSEGLSRTEAVEGAWSETEKRFPPLRCEQIELRSTITMIQLSHFPPEGCIEEFNDIWRLGWLALARVGAEAASDYRKTALVDQAFSKCHETQDDLVDEVELDAKQFIIESFVPHCREQAERLQRDDETLAGHLVQLAESAERLGTLRTSKQVLRLLSL